MLYIFTVFNTILIFFTLVIGAFLLWRLYQEMTKLAGQVLELRGALEDLTDAIKFEAGELKELFEALNSKLTEAGEVDPDLTDLIESVKSSISNIESLSELEEESDEIMPPVEGLPDEIEDETEEETPVEEGGDIEETEELIDENK